MKCKILWYPKPVSIEWDNLVSVPSSAIAYLSAFEWFAYLKHFQKFPQFCGFHFLGIYFFIKVNCLSDFAYMIANDRKAVI